MARRLKLHEELCEILGTKNVYFQPPATVRMGYPCIKYSLSDMDIKYANDMVYNNTNCYEIVVIDPNPDSDIYERILNRFSMCTFDRPYVADNLNHFILKLYY